MRIIVYSMLVILLISRCGTNDEKVSGNSNDSTSLSYAEMHRPQFHFSPSEKWMNDPNGMVYYNGEYHLFYQYYPGAMVWGPMHWGHAVSSDLVHWEHLPIALYPDSLGYIFSGSAIVDKQNTSGFGTIENPPLVSIYTYHNPEKEMAGSNEFQYQGIAFSIDRGRTWTKYEGNPVIQNPGARDFRDPKVFWHDASKNWVLILAVKDHVELWNSPDLKTWKKLSDFGYDLGAHTGVWECPDLFELNIEGEKVKKWVMIVSINPGGPNGGSATQYFVGDFDGKTFLTDQGKTEAYWADFGPDNYAGVTWFNAPDNRIILLGWMNNWAYADKLPTSPWRGANTVPRELSLVRTGGNLYLKSTVVPELSKLERASKSVGAVRVNQSINVSKEANLNLTKSIVSGLFDAKSFSIELSNSKGQKLSVGFDQKKNRFFIDRSKSGNIYFSNNFKYDLYAPRFSSAERINLTLVVDVSSIEVFFDDGLTVMTALFFPDQPLEKMEIISSEPINVDELQVTQLRSIWK